MLGSGTWTNIFGLVGWGVIGSDVLTNGKVGIGVTGTLSKALEVNGDAIFSGNVYASNFVLSDVTLTQGHLTFQTEMFMNSYDGISGNQNEIYTQNYPYYIQSRSGFNNNTYINYNNTGKLGIGTDNPAEKMHVVGTQNLRVMQPSPRVLK